MSATMTIGQFVLLGLAIVIGCIVVTVIAAVIDERAILRKLRKWEKEQVQADNPDTRPPLYDQEHG